jgi:hypothetical protein
VPNNVAIVPYKYILEAVQGEIKAMIFDSTAQHQSAKKLA